MSVKWFSPLITILIIVLLSFTIGCNPTRTLTPNSSYLQIVRILDSDRPAQKDLEFVEENLQNVINSLENSIDKELEGDSRFRWRNAATIYSRLQRLSELVNNSPEYSSRFSVGDYSSDILDMNLNTADLIFEEATEALTSGSRQGAKTAYFQFLEIDALSNGMIETDELKNEALNLSRITSLVYVDTLNDLNISLDSLQQGIQTVMKSDGIAGPFVNFLPYDPDNSESDHLVTIKLEDYITGQVMKANYSQQVEGSQFPFEILEESMDVIFVFSISIEDLSLNRVLDNSTVRIERKLENLVGTFEGDPGILNDYQRSLLDKEAMEKNPLQAFMKIEKPAITMITGEILDFYQNY